jgi:hypothetical protein
MASERDSSGSFRFAIHASTAARSSGGTLPLIHGMSARFVGSSLRENYISLPRSGRGHEFPQLSTDVISLWVLRPSFAV